MSVAGEFAEKLRAEKKKETDIKAKRMAEMELEKLKKQARMQFVELEVFLKMLDVAAKRNVNIDKIDVMSKRYIEAAKKHGGGRSKEAQAVLLEFKKMITKAK